MKNVLAKLNKIQTELKAPKGQFNSFGKYKYRSCEDILESVKPFLYQFNCVIVIGDNMVLHGERYYIEATVTLYDCESGETISNKAFAREELDKKGMDASQITGTASSYARKYALNGLLAIDDTKDADSTNTHGKDSEKAISELVEVITPLQAKTIRDLAEQVGSDIDAIVKYVAEKTNIPVDNVENFNKSHYAWASSALNKKIESAKEKK